MKKSAKILSLAAVGLGTLAFTLTAQAQSKTKTFAMVPKLVGVAFYADVEKGCKAQAQKLKVTCVFTGGTTVDEAEQVSILRDLVTKGVDGLAIAPNGPESVAKVIADARAKGIPVITFDSDAPKTARQSYVGTDNYQAGKIAGKAMKDNLKKGGKYAILTGGLSADNLNQRIKGFRENLGTGFKEVAGSPFASDDDSNKGIQIIQDLLTRNPDLDGIFYVGGWPMWAPEAYKRALSKKVADIKSGKFTVVSFDADPAQLQLLKDGYATALIGQRTVAMGTKSIDTLLALSNKKTVPAVQDLGVDVISSKNVTNFLKK